MAKQGRRASTSGARRVPILTVLVVALAVTAVAALAYYSTRPQTGERAVEECTPNGLHEHASFRVYVNNASISWKYPAFGWPQVGRLAGHVHLPAEHTIHLEGGHESCTTIQRFFANALLSRLTPDLLILDEEVHQGATYRDGQDGELRFFLRRVNDTWREEPQLPYHQPRDNEYLLITFGNESDGAIAWQQRSVPRPIGTESGMPE